MKTLRYLLVALVVFPACAARRPPNPFVPLPDLAKRAGLNAFIFPRAVFLPGTIVRVNAAGEVIGAPIGSVSECGPTWVGTPLRGAGLSGEFLTEARRGIALTTQAIPLSAAAGGRATAVLRIAGTYSSVVREVDVQNFVSSQWALMSPGCRATLQAPDTRVLTEVIYASANTTLDFVEANGQALNLSEQDLLQIASTEFGAFNARVDAGRLRFDSDVPIMYAMYRATPPRVACAFSVDVVANPRYVDCVMSLSAAERSRVMVDAAVALRSNFETISRTPQSTLTPGDFSVPLAVVEFLRRVDADNGHALYYEGTIRRWIYKDNRVSVEFLRSNEPFLRYLQIEEALSGADKAGNANACYTRPRGYCAERTAWIAHQLANDVYTLGVLELHLDKKRGHFIQSLRHAERALAALATGFTEPGQGVPTKTIVDCLSDLLAGTSLVTPTEKCPPPIGPR